MEFRAPEPFTWDDSGGFLGLFSKHRDLDEKLLERIAYWGATHDEDEYYGEGDSLLQRGKTVDPAEANIFAQTMKDGMREYNRSFGRNDRPELAERAAKWWGIADYLESPKADWMHPVRREGLTRFANEMSCRMMETGTRLTFAFQDQEKDTRHEVDFFRPYEQLIFGGDRHKTREICSQMLGIYEVNPSHDILGVCKSMWAAKHDHWDWMRHGSVGDAAKKLVQIDGESYDDRERPAIESLKGLAIWHREAFVCLYDALQNLGWQAHELVESSEPDGYAKARYNDLKEALEESSLDALVPDELVGRKYRDYFRLVQDQTRDFLASIEITDFALQMDPEKAKVALEFRPRGEAQGEKVIAERLSLGLGIPLESLPRPYGRARRGIDFVMEDKPSLNQHKAGKALTRENVRVLGHARRFSL